ncbi:MAG: WYL domain-containing protein [Campylobacter sp.]|nr:WYL domain-containing protein [Campylobacter sp.]
MIPFERKTEFVVRLMRGQTLNTKRLSKEFNIDVRSIQRNIKDIKDFFDNNYKIYGLKLEKIGNFYQLISHNDAQSEITEQFIKEMNKDKNKDSSSFLINLNYEKVDPKEIVTLKEAVESSVVITATYMRNKARYIVTLEPYRVAFMEKFWYLIAADTGDDNKIKTYRISKLEDIVKTNESFKFNKDILNKAHLAINAFFSPDREFFDVELLIDKEVSHYFLNPPIQSNQRSATESDGSMRLELSITHEKEIIPTILSWLPHVKVISPKFLADEIKQRVSSYAKEIGL